ncbi:MAG TPA: SAM-dependent methyltransferase [Ramlibacter sp.]|uniref:SAM-dependent methyltransferase n=1 Tax=Ramlibacter sp. TaxID=1917967 RepID=UPI002ED20A25
MASGRLYLVPAPLDFGCETAVPVTEVLPAGTIAVAAGLTHWVCENAKTARAFLKRIGELQPLALPLQQQQIAELPREVHKKGDHGPAAFDAKPLLQAAVAGHDVGLLSEAGMPAIADPGSSVVRAAHELGIEVVPLVGPVSLLLALAASGLNGQNFAFVGYLPQDGAARTQRLRDLEAFAARTGQTQLFIETPYRNAALWQAMVQGLKPATRIAVASGLTLPQAKCRSASVAAWKKEAAPVANDVPAVFAIGV